jgi:poly(hydroxyalkanoate) depolymerase family esterase
MHRTTLSLLSLTPLALGLTGSLAACDGPIGADDATATDAAELTAVSSFGSNPGALKMYVYSPAGVPDGAPLVLALHGCTQTASDYTNAGWNELADKYKFHVVYPEQQKANNQNGCFNWFSSGDITRGQGEAESIVEMVSYMKSHSHVDGSRVFITDLSAGAAMTNVMLATYPDVFNAGAIMAGLPYACATSTSAAYSCMNPGVDKTPAAWGSFVRRAARNAELAARQRLSRRERHHRRTEERNRDRRAMDQRPRDRRDRRRERDHLGRDAHHVHGQRRDRRGRALEHSEHVARYRARSRIRAGRRLRARGGLHARRESLLDLVRSALLRNRHRHAHDLVDHGFIVVSVDRRRRFVLLVFGRWWRRRRQRLHLHRDERVELGARPSGPRGSLRRRRELRLRRGIEHQLRSLDADAEHAGRDIGWILRPWSLPLSALTE